MEKFISQTDLDRIVRHEVRKNGKGFIEQVKSEKRQFNKGVNKSIFLSHSHKDKTIVDKMVLLFNKLDIELYIDWMDITLPEFTDRSTALMITEKIGKCNKFLFLATYNALRSKWCNWELGLAYSSKGESDFAILPIESRSGKWTGNEYLHLYPEMKLDMSRPIEELMESDISISINENEPVDFRHWFEK